jgi:carbon monoxide dehydrogenase subunit G
MSAESTVHITAERTLSIPRSQVWDALQDPQVLKACIPKCDSITRTGNGEYDLLFSARFGLARISLTGRMRLSELQPHESYTLHFEGEAFASRGGGCARVRLCEPDGGGTLIRYDLDVFIGGAMGRIGSPIVRAAVERGLGRFFDAFEQHVLDEGGAHG